MSERFFTGGAVSSPYKQRPYFFVRANLPDFNGDTAPRMFVKMGERPSLWLERNLCGREATLMKIVLLPNRSCLNALTLCGNVDAESLCDFDHTCGEKENAV